MGIQLRSGKETKPLPPKKSRAPNNKNNKQQESERVKELEEVLSPRKKIQLIRPGTISASQFNDTYNIHLGTPFNYSPYSFHIYLI